MINSPGKQEGAILIISLLMLLLVTVIGFAVMETSNLESKMAAGRELKEISFQTAEAIIEDELSNLDSLGQAFNAYLQDPNDPAWPTDAHTYSGYDVGSRQASAAGTSEMRFISTASAVGYSMRKGSSGIETYYYEVDAQSSVANSNISNTHVQGVFIEAPRVN